MKNVFYKSMQTVFGVLKGRDAIFLNDTYFDGYNLTLRIILNGRLGSVPKNEDRHYILSFLGALAFTVTDIDLYYRQSDVIEDALEDSSLYEVNSDSEGSNFVEVIGSLWLEKWKNEDAQQYHHYSLATYDNNFEIICLSYTLEEIV